MFFSLAQAQDKDATYKPVLGQMGKDVMWLPTPNELVDKMLDLAQVTADDLLFDLGAGDGVIAIAAAKQRGARAVGIEYNPKLAAYAQAKVIAAGVQDKVRIVQGDIFETDFSQATVITMYLLPEINDQLRPTLLKMKPGTRVVSHDFDMLEWEPDAVVQGARSRAMLWVVPAHVAGEWIFKPVNAAPFAVRLDQIFQRIGGTITLAGRSQALVGAQLQADRLRFQYVADDQTIHTVNLLVNGHQMQGHDSSLGFSQPLSAQRR
ncbi:MAG: methyltransferase domain-containing protein [Betaproteobacteria bacterium]|nr:methyltransferase domain-containing protein [Betaproteobacteria bacterium]NBY06330.1 methyltransferase domain-containing protein [Betaproteobacteria bacterium]